jgi:hypothetical protein
MAGTAPGGLSWESFESISLEVGDWVWGTAQGAFNEKATLSQILVDAVIGMIPFVGDVTGVRDLIAVVIGLATDPRKRQEKSQWLLLVILLFALIPVIGGVVKGVGRMALKTMGELAQLAGEAERAAKLAEAAQDVVAFLNRVGVGNAERWLAELKVTQYQQQLIGKFDQLLATLKKVLEGALARAGEWLPDALVNGTRALESGLETLQRLAPRYIPDALKQLDDYLRELQAYVRSGGETTSQAIAHHVEVGAAEVQRVDELILLEGKGATRSARGGFVANSADQARVGEYYKPEAGFPDVTGRAKKTGRRITYPRVATYSGTIVNRNIEPGERVFRVFGPDGGVTHGVTAPVSEAAGRHFSEPSFWGLNAVPSEAETWRKGSAVLDEWNHDGFIVVGTVLEGHSLPACTGLIAEQAGMEIGSQYLRGGDKQAMLHLPSAVSQELNTIGQRLSRSGIAETIELAGVHWELRATGWSDANGVYGYLHMPGPGSVQTARLGAKTVASKREKDQE